MLAGALGLSALRQPPRAAPIPQASYQSIDTERLRSVLPHKDFLLVNVPVPYEGEIEQTDPLVPYMAGWRDAGHPLLRRGPSLLREP